LEAVNQFLSYDVLTAAGSIRGQDATVADVLNIASKNLEGKFQDQLLVEAQVRYHLGWAYRRIGEPRAAVHHLQRSYQLYSEHRGEQKNTTLTTKNYLALEYFNAGQYRQAERLFDELIQESNPGSQIPLPEIKCNLALVYIEQGRYAEAERLLNEGLSSKTAWLQTRYGWQKKPFSEHLAEIYICQGRYEQAEQLLKERKKENAPNGVVYSMYCLGRLYMIQKRYGEAEEEFTNGIEVGRRTLPGKENLFTLRNINGLAVLRIKQKKFEDAERLFQTALEARTFKLGDDHPHTLESKNDLAVLYKEQNNYDKAEPLLLEAIQGRRLKLGDTHPHTIESWNNLIDLYEAWNKPEKAEEWRAKLPKIEAVDE
jgi:tetratricopeptide (TPR) repeat protein